MGLELNLKDLSGKAMVVVERAIAKADKDGNGKIDFDNQEEVTVFAQEIKEQYQKGNLKMDEYIQLNRPVDTDKVVEEEPTKKEARQAKKEAKAENKRAEEIVLRYMDELAAGGATRKDLLELLDERIGAQKDDPRYVEIRTAITEVVNALASVPSKTPLEIDKNHDDVRKALKAAGKDDKLHRELLKDVEKMIKTEMINSAYNEISAIYAEIVAEDQAKGIAKRTDEAIMNDVKARLKEEGKYSNGTHEQDYQNPYVDAFKKYENNKVMADARDLMARAIYGQVDSTEWRDIKAEAKQSLKDSGVYDKYVAKAFSQDFGDAISGEKKLSRTMSENQALENNVAFHSIQTKDEILTALSGKKEVFESLVSQGLIVEREDGYYDMKALQEILNIQVGADYTQARDAKEDRAISEKLRTLGKLSVETKLNSLTEKEAKELLLLCGFDIEKKDWTRVILQTIFGGVSAGLAGGAFEATRPIQRATVTAADVIKDSGKDLVINVTADNNNTIKLPSGETIDIIQGANVTVTLGNIVELLDTRDVLVQFMRSVPRAALTSGLIGAGLSFLNALGAPEAPAVPVTVTQFEEKDINEYLTRVAKETPEYVGALSALALTFVDENGNWNVEEYKSFLNKAAGDGHKLERDELIGAMKKLQGEIKPDTTEETTQEEELPPPPAPTKIAEGESYEHKTREAAIPTIDGGKTSWTKLAQSYECLVEKHGLKKAIRLVKIAQAITDGNYTEERLEELYNLSLKGASKLKNIEGVDYDMYYGALMGTALSRYEYDENGNIIPGTGVKVPTMLAGCKRDENMDTSDKYTGSRPNKYVAPKGHAADTVTEHYAVPVWGVKINDGPIEVYYNKAESDARFAEAREQYPDAKIEKLTKDEINEAIK